MYAIPHTPRFLCPTVVSTDAIITPVSPFPAFSDVTARAALSTTLGACFGGTFGLLSGLVCHLVSKRTITFDLFAAGGGTLTGMVVVTSGALVAHDTACLVFSWCFVCACMLCAAILLCSLYVVLCWGCIAHFKPPYDTPRSNTTHRVPIPHTACPYHSAYIPPPGCFFYQPWAAAVGGILGGLIYYPCSLFVLHVLRVDDPTDSFVIHGVRWCDGACQEHVLQPWGWNCGAAIVGLQSWG